ncbi:MAG: universal stress protein [Deltaproteobacteria bacterium]|nr:universal stress protein [Candidatus Anaeroferrophillacea bacterium]
MALRILVPVDESLASFRVMNYLIRRREDLQPRVTLVTVIPLSELAYRGIPDFQLEMIKDNALKMGKKTLERHRDEFRQAGISVDILLEKGGAPGDVICALAARESFDMICIAPNSKSEMSQMVFGSVTNHVIYHAPCPVLLVR